MLFKYKVIKVTYASGTVLYRYVLYPGEESTIPFTISIPSVMDTCFHMCYSVKQVAIDNSSCLTLLKFVKQIISILLHMQQFKNKFWFKVM